MPRRASLLARLQPSDSRPAAEAPAPDSGFKTAAAVAATPPSDEPPAQPFRSAAAAAPEEARESPTNVASPAAPPAENNANTTTTSLELQIVGLRYQDGRRFLRQGAAVTLRREPNEHDANAIEAWIPGELLAPVQLGFLRRGAAAALAPLIDDGVVAVVSCVCCAAAGGRLRCLGGDDATRPGCRACHRIGARRR